MKIGSRFSSSGNTVYPFERNSLNCTSGRLAMRDGLSVQRYVTETFGYLSHD